MEKILNWLDESAKYLGIYIDHKLTFKQHINHITQKLRRGNTLIARLRHFIDLKSMINFYYANIQSFINYGAIAWTTAAKSYIDKVSALQKTSVKLLFPKNLVNPNENSYFKESNILPLEKYIFLTRCVFIWKIVHEVFDENILLKFNNIEKQPDFDSSRKFIMPFRSTSAGLNFLTCSGIKQWNRLDQAITGLKSLPFFKRKTKKFLNK